MILYDPTEGRSSTLIPGIRKIGIPAPGLEAATAGDIIVISDEYKDKIIGKEFDHPEAEEVARMAINSNKTNREIADELGVKLPVVIKVIRMLAATERGVIIQRKSGSDLLGSIPELSRILEKMLVWTRLPWLMTTGELKRTDDGKVLLNGRKSDFLYRAVQGAKNMWQVRGGYVSELDSDESIFELLDILGKQVAEYGKSKILFYRPPVQKIVGPQDEDAWMTTLLTFPEIGQTTSRAIGDWAGNLALALCFLSDEDAPTWKDKPAGFGPVASRLARKRLGLLSGQRLMIVNNDMENNNGKHTETSG